MSHKTGFFLQYMVLSASLIEQNSKRLGFIQLVIKKLMGFTILELLVTLSIFSILSLLVIPSYFGYQSRHNVSLKAWEIKRALELARSTAVAKYLQIKACPSSLHYSCVTESGIKFLVFKDINGDHQWSRDEPIYKDIGIDDFKVKLSASGGRPFFRFKPTGESMESGNILVCNPFKTDFAKQVIVFSGGRIRFSMDKDIDGYDEKSGKPIDCKNN